MITEKELRMTDEEYAQAQKTKARKRLIRWSGAMTVVVGLAWGVYYLINGSIPNLGEGFGFDQFLPIEVSRIWADMFFAPILVIVFKLYAKLQGYRTAGKAEKVEEVIFMEGFFAGALYLIISFFMSIAVGTALFIPFMITGFILARIVNVARKVAWKLWERFGDLIDWLNAKPSRREWEALREKANANGGLCK